MPEQLISDQTPYTAFLAKLNMWCFSLHKFLNVLIPKSKPVH